MKTIESLISHMEKEKFLEKQTADAKELNEKNKENELIISVMGQFKRGKSSLINSLLDEELLPTGIIPLTTVVTDIRYADKFKASVLYKTGTECEITRQEIEEYCSEEKNEKNHKNVMTLKLWTNRQPFGKGTVLVDTPGVGSVNQHNTDSTCDYLKYSDAVIFLLSVDSPVSRTEQQFLLQIKDYAAKFFFVVNKVDTVSEEELGQFMQYAKKVLEENLHADVFLQRTSAKTGTGVKELLGSISEELRYEEQEIQEISLYKKVKIMAEQVRSKIMIHIQASELPKVELEKKIENLEEKKEKIEGFEVTLKTMLMQRAEKIIQKTDQILREKSIGIKDDTVKFCEKMYQEKGNYPMRKFENEMDNAIKLFMKEKLKSLNKEGNTFIENEYMNMIKKLNIEILSIAESFSDLLENEFGVSYPVVPWNYKISERSDFLMHIGKEQTFMMNAETLNRFLPRKLAKKRLYRRTLDQIDQDIERNRNNMLYNYRYKMKESIRDLSGDAVKEIQNLEQEMELLLEHLKENMEKTEQIENSEKERYDQILKELKILTENKAGDKDNY